MDLSNSSSDDDISIYTNAAKKLKELNSKKKVQLSISKSYDDNSIDNDNDEDDNDIIYRDDSPSIAVSKNVEKPESLAKEKLILIESSDSSCDSTLEKNSQIKTNKTVENQIEIMDEDSSDNGMRKTRSSRKRKVTNDSKTKNSIPNRVKNTIDDSFEDLLNDSYDNSFQLSQEDNDGYVLIGSPPPAKKSNDDYEVSVKVLWKSNQLERFEIRLQETFQKIFMHFAKLEGVPENQIRITKQGKRINPFDTPLSVNWSILDIFDGGIVSADVAKKKYGASAQEEESQNTCKIKIQTSEKGTLNLTMKKTDKFEVLLNECAKQLNIPTSKLKFFFDGELVDLNDAPETLELDDENCFDLKIFS